MSEPLKLTSSIENLRLKDKTEPELIAMLLDGYEWTPRQRQLIEAAYQIAKKFHAADEYKGNPYILHLLRVANRICGYLNIYDAEIIAAALLHDLVEDHAKELCPQAAAQDPHALQQSALSQLAEWLTPRVAEVVALVTNAPTTEGATAEQKTALYNAKIKSATATFEGWVIKFSDWCDNGLGIKFGANLLSSQEISHFQYKYGGEVLATYDKRFREPDIQSRLDTFAKGYVESQLAKGHQRLPGSQHPPEKRKFSLKSLHF